jgi:Cu-processing system permease protein
MLVRIATIALNTYREAVRARLLLGVFAMGLATAAYAVVIGAQSLNNDVRVVADIGAASFSFYGVLAAIVLGSTSLYREIEHRTVFPILSRPIRRWEYLLGKYAGIVLTVAVFVLVEMATVLALLSLEAGERPLTVAAIVAAMIAVLGFVSWRAQRHRAWILIGWAAAVVVPCWFLARPAFEERTLVTASAVLALLEVAIVTAVTMLFSAFSSPFLTAACTAMIFIIGRSADALGHLPSTMWWFLRAGGHVAFRIVPNLQVYVPPRPLLMGEAPTPVWQYVGTAGLQALAYSTALLVVAALVFRKRDFA